MRDLLLGFEQPEAGEAPQRLYLEPDVRRSTHSWIVGSTGSGKSKFLEWLIRGDILNGQGLMLLDLHGKLYDDVLRWCCFNNFVNVRPIVLIDPSAGEYVIGCNPFRPKTAMDIEAQVDGMVQALLRVWGAERTDQTPSLDRVLRLLFSAMVTHRIPLQHAAELVSLRGRAFREAVIPGIENRVIRGAWEDLHALSRAGDFRAEVLSTQNRIMRLASFSSVTRFMGLTDDRFNIDPLKLMKSGAIVLVNLKPSASFPRTVAEAFAALLLNEFFQAAMCFRSEDAYGNPPKPFYIYLDEWQRIATPDIGHVLTEARKFGLNLVLANQTVGQVTKTFGEEFLEDLLSCCQIKVCFGGASRKTARLFAENMLVGQIDLNETKYVLESTKFWPTLSTETIVTRGRSKSANSGRSGGRSTTDSRTEQFDVDGTFLRRTSIWPYQVNQGSSLVASDGYSSSEGESESETVADIPVIQHDPFTEVSSRVTYSLEEQMHRWSDRLMASYTRHCFVKLPGCSTVPMLVPKVTQRWVGPKTLGAYKGAVASRIGARRPEEVDELLRLQEAELREALEPSDEEAGAEADDMYGNS